MINIEKINNIQKDNTFINKKSKIKRAPSVNSFFDDIKYDNNQNNIIDDNNNYNYNKINYNNNNIYNDNYQNVSDFNMTHYGLANRPEIKSNHHIEKDDIHNTTNNNINKINDNKNSFPIKRHNSMITSITNKFLDINKETNTLNNTNNNYNNTINNIPINNNNITNNNNQNLYDEIQKLKKENKRLLLKNNELSLKIKTQEAKTKINSNYNKINQKKLSSQKEEFLLQKIKKLENEIIKQKDIITKLTYNKRFNIGIRKIRVNSILIKGNDNRLKRKNSNSILLNNLYCNNYSKNNFNKTLTNNVINKFIKKKNQNIKTNKEDVSLHIKPSYSSISASPINLGKKKKNEYNIKNKDMNKTMVIYNKDNPIKLKLDKCDIAKFRNNKKKKEFKQIKTSNLKINQNSIEEKKSNEENNIIKAFGENNYKKTGPHKTYGKTSLIMSVINDNLLGNFNLSQYMNQHSNKNITDYQKK